MIFAILNFDFLVNFKHFLLLFFLLRCFIDAFAHVRIKNKVETNLFMISRKQEDKSLQNCVAGAFNIALVKELKYSGKVIDCSVNAIFRIYDRCNSQQRNDIVFDVIGLFFAFALF